MDYYHTYGNEIPASAVVEANTAIGTEDWVARVIYAEHTSNIVDQNAVTLEIHNRLHDTARRAELSKSNPATPRSIIFYPNAYAPITNKVSNLLKPNQDSTGWHNAVDLARKLCNGSPLPVVVGISTHEFHNATRNGVPSWGKRIIQPGGAGGNWFYSY